MTYYYAQRAMDRFMLGIALKDKVWNEVFRQIDIFLNSCHPENTNQSLKQELQSKCLTQPWVEPVS